MVPAKDYLRLMQSDPQRIFAFLVDIYGRKIAEDIAAKVISKEQTPDVQLAKF